MFTYYTEINLHYVIQVHQIISPWKDCLGQAYECINTT